MRSFSVDMDLGAKALRNDAWLLSSLVKIHLSQFVSSLWHSSEERRCVFANYSHSNVICYPFIHFSLLILTSLSKYVISYEIVPYYWSRVEINLDRGGRHRRNWKWNAINTRLEACQFLLNLIFTWWKNDSWPRSATPREHSRQCF